MKKFHLLLISAFMLFGILCCGDPAENETVSSDKSSALAQWINSCEKNYDWATYELDTVVYGMPNMDLESSCVTQAFQVKGLDKNGKLIERFFIHSDGNQFYKSTDFYDWIDEKFSNDDWNVFHGLQENGHIVNYYIDNYNKGVDFWNGELLLRFTKDIGFGNEVKVEYVGALSEDDFHFPRKEDCDILMNKTTSTDSLLVEHETKQIYVDTQVKLDNKKLNGTKLEQAELLLREVPVDARFGKNDKVVDVPKFLKSILLGQTKLLSKEKIKLYLKENNIMNNEVGGNIDNEICRNSKKLKAHYMIFHDVSLEDKNNKLKFPSNINESTYPYNQVKKKYGNAKEAHAYIGRTGQSISPKTINFSTPWRATQYEMKSTYYRGLFIHIELVQPRIFGANIKRYVQAPVPGFTTQQYDRLALLYLVASTVGDNWLIPAYHARLDEGIPGGHDDPQNFELNKFNQSLEKMYNIINNK